VYVPGDRRVLETPAVTRLVLFDTTGPGPEVPDPCLDSRVTLWTKTGGVTFRPVDVEKGPVLIPEHGLFIVKAGSGTTARQFAAELAAKNLKSIRQLTREHREVATGHEPDNGTAGWFLEHFRNLLVMEEGPTLWSARGTPRAWLEAGKRISVQNAPTCFGTVAYEIVSDVDHGKITATIEVPSRKAPAAVQLRFRHPKSAPLKSVTSTARTGRRSTRTRKRSNRKG
jgi:hypothetical protein